jgi:plastocyanin
MADLGAVRWIDAGLRWLMVTLVVALGLGVGYVAFHTSTARALSLCSTTHRNEVDCEVDATGSLTFSPQDISVVPGVTVTWLNTATFAHNVTSDSGAVESFGGNPSGDISNNGSTFFHKFMTLGVDGYHCRFHAAAGMVGTIDVISPTAAPYNHLHVRIAHGWTVMRWGAAFHVAGFNVYAHGLKLNHKLVTSKTTLYHFRVHAIVHRPQLRVIG